jgi:hypothetical protein
MTTLGIFGDSFAQDTSIRWSNEWSDVGPSWIDYLRNTNQYSIINHALGGTSTYWSKKIFDQHYKNFDKIIFIATFPCRRITFNKLPEGCTQITNTFYNASSVFDIIENKKQFNSYNLIEKTFLMAVRDYYLYIQNDHFDHTMHLLMLDDIKEKRPDAILIPAFPSSIPSLDNAGSSTLLDISQKDTLHFGLGEHIPNSSTATDARKCHLNEENHKILADKILKFLQGDPVYLNKNDFVNPSKDFTHYFRKRFW